MSYHKRKKTLGTGYECYLIEVTIWRHRTRVNMGSVMTSTHYLNQYCLVFSEVLRHSHEDNSTEKTMMIVWYEFKNCNFKITATSSRGQWVERKVWKKPVCYQTPNHYPKVYWYIYNDFQSRPFTILRGTVTILWLPCCGQITVSALLLWSITHDLRMLMVC